MAFQWFFTNDTERPLTILFVDAPDGERFAWAYFPQGSHLRAKPAHLGEHLLTDKEDKLVI